MASGYTQAQLTALQGAFASGHLRVTHDGSTFEYRNTADLERAIQRVESGLAADAGTVPVRQVRVVTSKGI